MADDDPDDRYRVLDGACYATERDLKRAERVNEARFAAIKAGRLPVTKP